jgi:teichuronic acid biosynthesis protein TuaE
MFIIEIVLSVLEALSIIRLPISPYSNYLHYFGRTFSFDPNVTTIQKNLLFHTPTGFQWNPNNLAIIMNIILPFFLFTKNLKLKVIGIISILYIIFATSSRGNIVAFFLMISIYLLFIYRYRKVVRIFFILAILLSASDTVTYKEGKSNQIVESFHALNTFFTTKVKEKSSLGIRQRYIHNGLVALYNTRGRGVGAGNSGIAEYHRDVNYGLPKISMHNFWIEILVDSGIIFTFIFLPWYGYVTFKLYRIYIQSKDDPLIRYFSIASALSMTGFIIGSVSASSVIYEFPMWILFGFSISIINISKQTAIAGSGLINRCQTQ